MPTVGAEPNVGDTVRVAGEPARRPAAAGGPERERFAPAADRDRFAISTPVQRQGNRIPGRPFVLTSTSSCAPKPQLAVLRGGEREALITPPADGADLVRV